MSPTHITRNEWLKALGDAGLHSTEDDPTAVTVMEFAAMMGNLGRSTAAHQLARLVHAGKAVETRKWVTTTYGRRTQCRAFKLIGPTKKR